MKKIRVIREKMMKILILSRMNRTSSLDSSTPRHGLVFICEDGYTLELPNQDLSVTISPIGSESSPNQLLGMSNFAGKTNI